MRENNQIAEFSRAVRESTLKRLRAVPEGLQNWCVNEGKLSFAEIAHHLVECDKWLIKKFDDPSTPSIHEAESLFKKVDEQEFHQLMKDLEDIGEIRASFLETLDAEQMEEQIFDSRFGEVTKWWVIIRGNLDHEIHHRGQISAYLQMIKS